jgi:hypothetical protein
MTSYRQSELSIVGYFQEKTANHRSVLLDCSWFYLLLPLNEYSVAGRDAESVEMIGGYGGKQGV